MVRQSVAALSHLGNWLDIWGLLAMICISCSMSEMWLCDNDFVKHLNNKLTCHLKYLTVVRCHVYLNVLPGNDIWSQAFAPAVHQCDDTQLDYVFIFMSTCKLGRCGKQMEHLRLREQCVILHDYYNVQGAGHVLGWDSQKASMASPQELSCTVKPFLQSGWYCNVCIHSVTHTLAQKAFSPTHTIIGKGSAEKWWIHSFECHKPAMRTAQFEGCRTLVGILYGPIKVWGSLQRLFWHMHPLNTFHKTEWDTVFECSI